jgi:hypothetical protein
MSNIAVAKKMEFTKSFNNLEGFCELPDALKCQLTVLLTFLHTIGRYVLNRDAIWLALDEARSICQAAGVPEEHIKTAVDSYYAHTGKVRKTNPMHKLYSDE